MTETIPDGESDSWDELLTSDVNDGQDHDTRDDPTEVQNAGVIRTVTGALDPRTWHSKLHWAFVTHAVLAAVVVPFAINAGMMLWAGASALAAAVVGIVMTVAYWRYC